MWAAEAPPIMPASCCWSTPVPMTHFRPVSILTSASLSSHILHLVHLRPCKGKQCPLSQGIHSHTHTHTHTHTPAQVFSLGLLLSSMMVYNQVCLPLRVCVSGHACMHGCIVWRMDMHEGTWDEEATNFSPSVLYSGL